jgi:plasmid stabilization system protein ParE
MGAKVVLSPKARARLDGLLEYLESEWSAKVKGDFIKKLDRSVSRISDFPKSCPESNEIPGLFKCVVTKQTSFIYRIRPGEIEIIILFDNRLDPKRLRGSNG